MERTDEPLLKVKHLRVWFPTAVNWLGTPTRFFRAVEDVSFNLMPGEVLGLVGEGGSGKTTIARAIAGLQAVESGQVFCAGRDLMHLNARGWRAVRRTAQLISSHASSSLDPGLRIGAALKEPVKVHRTVPHKEADNEVQRLLQLTGLPEGIRDLYPNQLSGVQRLRVAIARSLALRPELMVLDEPFAALEDGEKADMLDLLTTLRATLKLSYLFISRDIAAVRLMASQLLIIDRGSIIERGATEEVLTKPRHEHTQRLVAAAMAANPGPEAT